jgi:hypothetical protein
MNMYELVHGIDKKIGITYFPRIKDTTPTW